MSSASDVSIKEIAGDIRAAIADLQNRPEIENTGIVTRIGDGVAWIYGLTQCGYNEMISVTSVNGEEITAFAFNLETTKSVLLFWVTIRRLRLVPLLN